MTRRGLIGVLIGVVESACASSGPPSPAGDAVVAEAATFMARYQKALTAGNADSLLALYHPGGVHLSGTGKKDFLSGDSLATLLRLGTAVAQARFDWHDLSYEPVGPNGIVVIGRFTETSAGCPLDVSYTGLLLRHDGSLRIRAEDESWAPESTTAGSDDSSAAGHGRATAKLTAPVIAVLEQVAAYNRHDLDAFVGSDAPDAAFYAFPDTLIAKSHATIRSTYERVFKQSPQIRVDVTGRAVAGEFVVPEETVSGSGEAAPRPTVVIYQVAGGKIARAWFLP